MANALKEELEGKVVLIKKDYLKPEYHDDEKRRFLCETGFGCHPWTMGNAVFGTYLWDGEQCRVEGWQIECLSDDQSTEVGNA
jgi:hypothetical protein